MDAKTELLSDKGQIKYAAHFLFGYYCLRRNKTSGLCSPRIKRIVEDTGIPRTNVLALNDFLEDIGWIHIYENGIIRPLKGFASDDQILLKRLKRLFFKREMCLIIRHFCLQNRQFSLIIRHLFKGNLNQPIEPASLTSEGTNLRSANPLPAPDDKNSADKKSSPPLPKSGFLGETNGNHPPAGKPTPPWSASARKPADERINHPAIKMVKEITGRYPPKDQWDKIIREIRNPDTEFFRSSYEIWGSFNGNRMNLQGWLFKPNKKGKLPEVYGEDDPRDGTTSPPMDETAETDFEVFEPEPLTDKTRQNALVILRGMLRNSKIEDLQNLKTAYTEEDWQWLMTELQAKSAKP